MLSKPNKKSKDQKASEKFEQINPNTAGIDIGSKSHYVAIPQDRDDQNVREFPTFTNSLLEMIQWFKENRINSVAMESTGVYWIPVYDLLEEHGFDVILVNARHIKNVPGRKTDVLDCQWIQQLHSYGLLRGSFRPKDKILKMRTLMRHRAMLIDYAGSHVQHMQKSLTLMNIQLTNVISDIMGVTGTQIIRAILAGERDPEKLAQFRDKRCRNSEKTIRESLIGNYREEHIFCLKQSLSIYDQYMIQIEKCDVAIEKIIKELEGLSDKKMTQKKRSTNKHQFSFDMHSELLRVTGIDLTAVPGLNTQIVAKIISEIGIDMSLWQTSKRFAAWLSLCPGNKISGGKRLSGRTNPSANHAAAALRMAANSLYHSDSSLGAFFRRMRMRLGAPKAITAAAHKLAVIIYNMLKSKKEYHEIGAQYYEEQYRNRCIKNLERRAEQLGFKIVPISL